MRPIALVVSVQHFETQKLLRIIYPSSQVLTIEVWEGKFEVVVALNDG